MTQQSANNYCKYSQMISSMQIIQIYIVAFPFFMQYWALFAHRLKWIIRSYDEEGIVLIGNNCTLWVKYPAFIREICEAKRISGFCGRKKRAI